MALECYWLTYFAFGFDRILDGLGFRFLFFGGLFNLTLFELFFNFSLQVDCFFIHLIEDFFRQRSDIIFKVSDKLFQNGLILFKISLVLQELIAN